MSNSDFSEKYKSALALLEKGEFANAESAFLDLRKEGFTAPQLEANIGFALFKQSKYPHSILHYQNARLLEPSSKEIEQQLLLAQKNISQGLGLPLSDPSEWAYEGSLYATPAHGFSLAFFMATLFFLFRKKSFSRYSTLKIYFLLLAILGGGTGLFLKKGSEVQTLVEKTSLFSGPIKSSSVTFEVPAGARVRVIKTSGDLAEIERPKSFRGWVEKKHLHVALEPYLALPQNQSP